MPFARLWRGFGVERFYAAVVARGLQQCVEHVRDVFDMFGDDMADPTFALQCSGDFKHPTCNDSTAIGFECLLPDDDIADPGFIFQRNEHHPMRRAWALSHKHEAGHADPRTIRGGLQLVMRQA